MAAYLSIIFWIYKEVKLVVKRVAVMISSISRITILFLLITLFLVVPGLAQEEEEFFEEEEIIETPWETTPASIANITDMARNRDPSLNFLPSNMYTNQDSITQPVVA